MVRNIYMVCVVGRQKLWLEECCYGACCEMAVVVVERMYSIFVGRTVASAGGLAVVGGLYVAVVGGLHVAVVIGLCGGRGVVFS
jgi:hypothetical protein